MREKINKQGKRQKSLSLVVTSHTSGGKRGNYEKERHEYIKQEVRIINKSSKN